MNEKKENKNMSPSKKRRIKREIVDKMIPFDIHEEIDFNNIGCLELTNEQFHELKNKCEENGINFCYQDVLRDKDSYKEFYRFFYFLDTKQVFMGENLTNYYSFLTMRLRINRDFVSEEVQRFDNHEKSKLFGHIFETKKYSGSNIIFDVVGSEIYKKFGKINELSWLRRKNLREERRLSIVDPCSIKDINWKLISEMFL